MSELDFFRTLAVEILIDPPWWRNLCSKWTFCLTISHSGGWGMSILMVARNRNCNEPLNWDDTMQWYLTVKLRRGTTWIITNSAFTREDRVSSLWILKTESRSRNVMFKSLFYSFFVGSMVGFAGVLRQVCFRILTCMLLSVQYPYVVTADLANSLDPNRRKLQKQERKKQSKTACYLCGKM